MNTKLLLLAISVAAFSSCTTLYKSGQTPDDVYFSPIRTHGVEDRQEEQRDEVKTYSTSTEDRSIRLGINDRRYRDFDNDYSYNPYRYGFNYGYYYNPYYWPYPVYSTIYTAPSNPKITTPRTTNLNTYNPGNIKTSTNTKTGSVRNVKSYNNSNNGSAVGNVIRQMFTPGESSNSTYRSNSSSNSSNSSSNNSRSYSPSSSSSSSSGGSSSSGSGSISRPSRGGGN